jgi:polysaccharide biosynthesis transport protein
MPATSITTAAFNNAAPPLADLEGKSIAEHWAVLRRRKWLMLGVWLLLLGVAAAVALLLPAVYRSTATILIKEQEIPQELVRSTVTSFADERIQVISQQVMTRATLLDLVDKYGLYGTARQRETSEEILDRMRRDIKLTPISAEVTDRRTGSPVKSTIAFTLSYDSEVAANAQKIANELTTLFLNENVKNRQQKAAETTSFLDEELARVNVHMSELEQQMSNFKRRNQGRTPDLGLSNLVGTERTESELQRIDRELAFLADRRLLLEGQLADTRPFTPITNNNGLALQPEERLRALQNQLASTSALYNDTHPDVRRLKREIANLKTETGLQDEASDRTQSLALLQSQLLQLRQKYSEEHPDVVKLKRAYSALELAVRAESANGPAGSLRNASKPDNPQYINLKTQIETTGSQIESLRSERKELQERLAQLSTRLSQTPEVEREFLALARDMDSSRMRFRELRDKQMQAQVAEQLERGRKAERFTLIEPPIFPERPNRPNRPLIFWLGLALSLAGAVGAVVLREALDSTVNSPRDVMRVLQVPVLAVWPSQPVAVSRQRQRWLWLLLGLVAMTLLVLAAAALHHFFMPLDVLGYGLLRRLSN